MRPVASGLLCLLLAAPAAVADLAVGSRVTVLLDFDHSSHSLTTLSALEREVSHLFGKTGVQVELKDRKREQGATYDELVLFRFRGLCRMADFAPLMDERGPLAWTHSADGEILPFAEVSCDKIRSAVERAMWGSQRSKRDELFGRALGRVVAHELYHILARTSEHGRKGVACKALSGEQLIAKTLAFGSDDIRRIAAHKKVR